MKKRLNIILGWNVIQNEITLPLELWEQTSTFNPNLPKCMNQKEKFVIPMIDHFYGKMKKKNFG